MMKPILLVISILLTPLCFAIEAVESLEEAREVKLTQVEFREPSQQGVVRISECNRCTHKMYTFGPNLTVIKNNNVSSINALLNDYWNASMAVIFIEPNTNQLTRISYHTQELKK